jgi:AcrR family transcriptional regulator
MALPSLREVKKERCRHAIIEAGLRLFHDRGFDTVTVADIAAAAEVAPRTLHRYFPTKDELVFAEDEDFRDFVVSTLQEKAGAGDLPSTMEALLVPVAAWLQDRHATLRRRDALIAATPLLQARELAKHAAIEQLVAEHLAARSGLGLDVDVRPRLWAKLLLACFLSGYRVWLTSGGELDQHVREAMAAVAGLTAWDT